MITKWGLITLKRSIGKAFVTCHARLGFNGAAFPSLNAGIFALTLNLTFKIFKEKFDLKKLLLPSTAQPGVGGYTFGILPGEDVCGENIGTEIMSHLGPSLPYNCFPSHPLT